MPAIAKGPGRSGRSRWMTRRGAWADRAAAQLPRPLDAPRGHAPGHNSDRILLFGAGPAVGWGVTTHELALPGAIARAVSARTHRGCDVDLVASTDMTAATAVAHADDRALERYDLVVVILGVNDALQHTAPALWRAAVSDLISAFIEGCPIGTPIVVVGIQPIRSIPAFDGLRGARAERRAQLLNRETERLCGDEPQATFVPLPAPTSSPSDKDRHRTARTYHAWGQMLAQAIVPLLTVDIRLDGDAGRAYPVTAGSMGAAEVNRQRAVDELAPPGRAARTRLQRILLLAQQAFGAQSAMITIIDRDRQWQLVGTDEPVELPRSISVCDVTIRGGGALVVRDSQLDARFRDNPLVTGGPRLRFYAGFPIESPAGQPLGALCVLDGEPRRPADELDVDLLRELAHMVQHELWPSGSDSARID